MNWKRIFVFRNGFQLTLINIIFLHSTLAKVQNKMLTLSAGEVGKHLEQITITAESVGRD